MKKLEKIALTVDGYIQSFPTPVQQRLRQVRKLIRTAAPKAEESISYGLVGYKLFGKPLVYFGGFKAHIGFYATPAGHAAFKKEMAKYQGAKGSVRFLLNEPLPLALIAKVVKWRIKENAAHKK